MYTAFWLNLATGELKRVSEPWKGAPPEWTRINEWEYEIRLKTQTQAARIAELEAALQNAAEALGEAQGEWASVSIAYCPEEIAPLKEAEAAALEVLDGDK